MLIGLGMFGVINKICSEWIIQNLIDFLILISWVLSTAMLLAFEINRINCFLNLILVKKFQAHIYN